MSAGRLNSLFIAVAFVLSGIVLLLFNLHLLGAYQNILRWVLTSLFALGGLGFLGSFFVSRQNWWRLIPAWTLLALAAMADLNLSGQAAGEITAALLFVGLALAFAHVYLLNRTEHWWAIMPGGFMLVLSAVIVLSRQVARLDLLGALLFIGLGLVFGLVVLGDRQRHWWALLPGTILVLFGLFLLSATTANPNLLLRWWPLALVIIGPLIGWWGARPVAADRLEVNVARKRNAKNMASRDPQSTAEGKASVGTLGEYTRPAPGASVEVLPDQER